MKFVPPERVMAHEISDDRVPNLDHTCWHFVF
jgi:hypothetical protein